MGKSVAEIEASIGGAELDDWVQYWGEEPWGSWRDNVHAGLIASACLSPWTKSRPSWSDFMVKTKERRNADDLESSLTWLMAVAKRKQ